jgi:NADPH-dependent curcumin reductase
MSRLVNRRVVLAARPRGEPAPGDLRLEEAPVPEPGDGQVLLRIVLLSLDPYMRLRMGEGRSYAPPVGIGEVMVGATVACPPSEPMRQTGPVEERRISGSS